jgi:hypothetical protein
VCVVFGVTIILGGKEVLADGGDTGSCCCEERGEVGGHCGIVLPAQREWTSSRSRESQVVRNEKASVLG